MAEQFGCRLYLITPPRISDIARFTGELTTVLDAGSGTAAEVACVQLRVKDVADTEILRATEELLPLCHKFGAALLINDRPDLARTSGADGVHIGQSDTPYSEARKLLGDDASIGVTCHNSRHLAMEAGEAGADYVAFGAFYPTTTKAVRFQADPALLRDWSSATTVPCVAIGGITAENARPLIKAGADFLAVSAGIWAHKEGVTAAMAAFAEILTEAP